MSSLSPSHRKAAIAFIVVTAALAGLLLYQTCSARLRFCGYLVNSAQNRVMKRFLKVVAALIAVAFNIALKIVLLYTTDLAQAGLALATSAGAWINFGLILWFGLRAGFIRFDSAFRRDAGKLAVAGIALAAVLFVAQWPVIALAAGLPAHNITALVMLAFLGALAYGAAIYGLFGKAWLVSFFRTPKRITPSSAPPAPE